MGLVLGDEEDVARHEHVRVGALLLEIGVLRIVPHRVRVEAMSRGKLRQVVALGDDQRLGVARLLFRRTDGALSRVR